VVGAGLRTAVRQAALSVLDRGVLGGCALQTHVVICGFPRSGSTLLLLIAEACYRNVRTYRQEKAALNAARELRRAHPVMITKRPSDLFQADEIRRFYEPLRTRPRFVLTMRDPRAVLTSKYSGKALSNTTRGPDGYVMSVDVWREWFAHFNYVKSGHDAIVVEFADLVTRPAMVQAQFVKLTGSTPAIPFDQFATAIPADFETKALNGVREFDAGSINRWRHPKYHDRIAQILEEMPELPRLLIELGYEQDETWADAYDRPAEPHVQTR